MYEEILLSKLNKGHRDHYIKRYLAFIESCRKNNEQLFLVYATEAHHILPKNSWPEYTDFRKNKWNKIVLTKKQHRIAHWIFARAFGGRENWYPVKMLYSKKLNKGNFVLKELDEIVRRLPGAFTNKKHSEQTKIKMSKARQGKTHSQETKNKIGEKHKNKKVSQETKNKLSSWVRTDEIKARMSVAFKNRDSSNRIGEKRSDETKEKIRLAALNREKKTCPYCLRLIGSPSSYSKFHGENCKLNS